MHAPPQRKPGPPAKARRPAAANRTGLPNRLKAGVESLSGLAMDDVRVHYNSSRPARLQALALTQGTEIHVGPGEERHLPHEAWHVVQQKQGRVRPTLAAGKVAVNDEGNLEREADTMGARAATLSGLQVGAAGFAAFPVRSGPVQPSGAQAVQRKILVGSKEYQLDGAIALFTKLAADSGITEGAITAAATLWNEQDFKFHGEMDVLPSLKAATFKSRALGKHGQGGTEFGRSSAFTDSAEAKTMVTLHIDETIDSQAEKDKPGYLYRAMTVTEFGNLKDKKKLVPIDNQAYMGLSGNPHYSAGAMTKGALSYLVEFEFTSKAVHDALIPAFKRGKIEGSASNQHFEVSKDLSTRSIGLGPQGNTSDEFKKQFNAWLGNGTVRWRLLRLIK